MNRAGLVKLLIDVARPIGYRHKGSLFWKTGKELTRLLHLQSSAWGKGLYVNFGATPNAMVIKPIPPGPGYWGLELRAPAWNGPYSSLFIRCENDHEDRMAPEQMAKALRWLLGQMEEYLSDAAFVRKVVLDPECVESDYASIMMKDWAKGKLKAPIHYFDDVPYYR